MVNSRGASYTCDEDRHLCHVYIDISKDPTIVANQRKDQFWSRVTTTYNSSKPNTAMQDRNQRSLQSRVHTIHQAVSKLNECLHQIERSNPSGASELDVLNRAKQIMRQDPKFRSGFKFDHVWPIMKDAIKFAPTRQRRINDLSLSQLDTAPESPLPEPPFSPPPQSSSFSLNLSDENVSGGSSSQQSEGAKKSKLKRKKGEDISTFIRAIQEENEKLRDENEKFQDLLRRRVENEQRNLELQKRKIELAQWKEENKILMINLDTLSDLHVREYFREERAKIIQKRETTTITRI